MGGMARYITGTSIPESFKSLLEQVSAIFFQGDDTASDLMFWPEGRCIAPFYHHVPLFTGQESRCQLRSMSDPLGIQRLEK